MKARNRILCIGMLALLSTAVAVGLRAELSVTADYDSVYVELSFNRHYYSGAGTCKWDLPCADKAKWDPDSSCAPRPTTTWDSGSGYSNLHFRILDELGNCMRIDSRIAGSVDTGWNSASFAIPVEEEQADGWFVFTSGSDYDTVVFTNYWQDSGFAIERESTYKFVVVEQVEGCGSDAPSDIEGDVDSESVYIPCCNGRVGDVNGVGGDEPTVSDVSLLIDALFISHDKSILPCLEEADVNQSGGNPATGDDITIGDVSVLIDYVYNNIGTLNDCI